MATEDIVFLFGHGRLRTKFPATDADEHLAMNAQLRVVVYSQLTVATTRTPASPEWITSHYHLFSDTFTSNTLFRHCLYGLLHE